MSATVARFTRFDFVTIATTQPARVLLPLAVIVVIGATMPIPGFAIVMGAVVASVSASVPFQGDERGRLDTLYGIAPVARSAVVIGRYVSLLVFAALAIGIGTATTLVMRAVHHEDFGRPLLATMFLVAFGCVCVAFAVQVPWFFALGFTRGRPMVYIPVAAMAFVGFAISQTGLFDGTTSLHLNGAPPISVAIGVLVAGVLLLVVSALVAVRLYRRREL